MSEERSALSRAFEKARDPIEAWRHQQVAALNDEQRRLYEDERRKSKEREKAKAKELEDSREAAIQERMRRKILEHARLELTPGNRRMGLSEALAARLTAQYFQPGKPPESRHYRMLLGQAARLSAADVAQDHERQQQAFRAQERAKLDDMLRRFERARQTQPQHRQAFAGAAEGAKKDALARAFEKAARQREQSRSHDHVKQAGRDRQRGQG
jgi:hypothetical protein